MCIVHFQRFRVTRNEDDDMERNKKCCGGKCDHVGDTVKLWGLLSMVYDSFDQAYVCCTGS